MVGESFEGGRKREFGDDARHTDLFRRYRLLKEEGGLARQRGFLQGEIEQRPDIQWFDSPSAFVAAFHDADECEAWLSAHEAENRDLREMIYALGRGIPWDEVPEK